MISYTHVRYDINETGLLEIHVLLENVETLRSWSGYYGIFALNASGISAVLREVTPAPHGAAPHALGEPVPYHGKFPNES